MKEETGCINIQDWCKEDKQLEGRRQTGRVAKDRGQIHRHQRVIMAQKEATN